MQQPGNQLRTPGGLLLPVSATLKGRIKWQVLDERGMPEVPRNPSGFALGPVEGIEQSNLITDLGLDQIAAFDCSGASPSSPSTWRRYLAVGTGSTTPTNGDTTLAAEVQRAASSGSFSNGATTYELDDTNDVWRAESLVTRVVTMNADRNIAEFGLSPESSGAIGIRELLRDGEGDPITVSLLTGKSLRVDHTLTVDIAAPAAGIPATINVAQYDAGNNLVSTTPYDIIHGGLAPSGNYDAVFQVWNPTDSTIQVRRVTIDAPYGRLTNHQNNIDPNQFAVGFTTMTLQAYVPGSQSRTRRGTLSAGQGNAVWHQAIFNTSADRWSGWTMLLENPVGYTKQNTDTLRFGLVSTWARAA